MDIARPSTVARRKRIRRIVYAVTGVMVVGLISFGLSRLEPAAPTVDAATLWRDVVKRGSMLRQVRGLGTLVPEEIRWIPATTQGRVEVILLRPGTTVTADSVILELSNPQLEQEVLDAGLRLQSAMASQENLKAQLESDALQQRATAASIEANYSRAQLQYEMDQALHAKGLVAELTLRTSKINAEQLGQQNRIAQEQVASRTESARAQTAVSQSTVDQARALLDLRRRQRDELKVRASVSGVLQVVPVEVGQQVGPGTNLARVANPSRLMARIQVAETQAKDIQINQTVEIDTRQGVVPGVVARIDPSVVNGTRTVDVSLNGELPRGAVPDLSVEGTVLIERLDDVMYVGRPAFGQEQSLVMLFKQNAEGTEASRVQVKLGRNSVNTVEVVEGLQVGDTVILSDMSTWDGFDRVRLR